MGEPIIPRASQNFFGLLQASLAKCSSVEIHPLSPMAQKEEIPKEFRVKAFITLNPTARRPIKLTP